MRTFIAHLFLSSAGLALWNALGKPRDWEFMYGDRVRHKPSGKNVNIGAGKFLVRASRFGDLRNFGPIERRLLLWKIRDSERRALHLKFTDAFAAKAP